MEQFIQKRDYDSVAKHVFSNLWQKSEELLKSSNRRCQAFAYQLKAQVQLKNDQFIDALYSLERERGILDSLSCKTLNYLEHYLTYGEYYVQVGEFRLGIESYSKALGIAQRTKNNVGLAKANLGLGVCNARLNNGEKALFYVNQAHPIIYSLVDNENKVDCLLNLSERYVKLYRMTKDRAYLDSSSNTTNYGYALGRKMGYTQSYPRAYNLLEDKAYYDKNYRVALLYFDSILKVTHTVYDQKIRGAVFGDMTDIYLELKKYEKAYQYADSNFVYAQKTGNPYELRNAYELLYNCAKLGGDYERALVLYQELTDLKDSVQEINNEKAFGQLQEKYHRIRKEKTEKEYEQDQRLLEKQAEIGQLKRRLIVVGIVILALMAAYVFMVFRQRNIKNKQKRLEIERRLQEARINPEFIYQAVSKLQQQTESGHGDAKKQLTAYSKLLKQVIDSTFNDFMTLDREIEFLSFYMNLQQETKKQNFRYEFHVDPQLDVTNVCVPTMLLQPFLESTLMDGFKGLPYEGVIEITFSLHQLNELAIKIQDNGKGLKAIDSTRANEIINDRIFLLNELKKSSASYLIRERSKGGVSVELFIPLITKAYAEDLRKNTI